MSSKLASLQRQLDEANRYIAILERKAMCPPTVSIVNALGHGGAGVVIESMQWNANVPEVMLTVRRVDEPKA